MNSCQWCRDPNHTIAQCSKAAALRVVAEHGVIDPMASEDLNDVLALRMFRERAAKGAYRQLALSLLNGAPVPQSVLDLDPDSHLYA